MEMYRLYRPQAFEEVIGQRTAVSLLKKGIKAKTLNHVILLHGPTGTGKTTLARIIARELGCVGPFNLSEINTADVRGIDSVRSIGEAVSKSPMGGTCRVWILDEVVQLPKATQQAFLQVLEECPSKAYFILCSNDIEGLLPTFLSRCLLVRLNKLSPENLTRIVDSVLAKAKTTLDKKVKEAVVSHGEGSARKTLQLLHTALSYEKIETQLSVINSGVQEGKRVTFLAKALLDKESFESVVKILNQIPPSEVEGLRRQILEYCSKVMLYNRRMRHTCAIVIEFFQFPFSDTGKPGLIQACYKCCMREGS